MILMNNDGYDLCLGYKMFDVLLFFLPEPTMSLFSYMPSFCDLVANLETFVIFCDYLLILDPSFLGLHVQPSWQTRSLEQWVMEVG